MIATTSRAIAAMAILVPSVFAATKSGELASRSVAFSVVVSVILLVVYVCSIIFMLRTHADLFRGEETEGGEAHSGQHAVAVARAHGTEVMFTLSGAHVFPMYDGAVTADPQMRIVDVRHEQTAAFAAEGEGRADDGR